MNAMLDSCFKTTKKTSEHGRCWTCLKLEWSAALDSVIKNEVTPKLELINVFSKQAVELDQLFTKLFSDEKGNIVQYDKDELAVAQNHLRKMAPNLDKEINEIVEGKFINFANLFKVFWFLLPDLMHKLETFKCRDTDALEYELNEVDRLNTKASDQEVEFNKYIDLIEPFIEKDHIMFRKFCENNNNFPYNLMLTPPVSRRCHVARMRNRLGLLKDSISKTKLFKEPSVPVVSRTNHLSKTSSRISLNNYKSQDAALNLLSKPKSRSNLSQSIHNTSAISKFSTPKFSSTMCQSVPMLQVERKFTPSFQMTPTTHLCSENVVKTTSMMSSNGISIVRKVAPNSVFNLNQPLIRSPTRRFQVIDAPRNLCAPTQTVITITYL